MNADPRSTRLCREAGEILAPAQPVLLEGAGQRPGAVFEPGLRTALEVGRNCGSAAGHAEVDIGGLHAHRLKQAGDVGGVTEMSQVDARAARSQTAYDPGVAGTM